MQKDIIKKWTQLSKKANDSLKKINILNTKSIKQLTKLQMDMVKSCIEGGVKKAKIVGKTTSMAELMNLQSGLYKELSEKVLESAQQSVKIAMETKEAMSALIKEGLADAPKMVVTASVKKTAPKATKKKVVAKKVAPKVAKKKVVAKKVAPKVAKKKVVAKKAAPKPVAKKVVAKKAAPKATKKKVMAKKAAPKPVAKKVVAKKVATKAAKKKVIAKKAAPKPAAKKVIAKRAVVAKPAAKKVAPKPAAKLQMPKPSGRPITEGDAKK
ncbi:MAG: phasin family protein [Cycloclasticus sp.]|nr:MAG: phasin family protein [Cycloclasticus sp.]